MRLRNSVIAFLLSIIVALSAFAPPAFAAELFEPDQESVQTVDINITDDMQVTSETTPDSAMQPQNDESVSGTVTDTSPSDQTQQTTTDTEELSSANEANQEMPRATTSDENQQSKTTAQSEGVKDSAEEAKTVPQEAPPKEAPNPTSVPESNESVILVDQKQNEGSAVDDIELKDINDKDFYPTWETLQDKYLPDYKELERVDPKDYKSIAAIAEAELGSSDNTEFPIGSGTVKYSTWAYGHRVSNQYTNGKYEEAYNWNAAFVSWCANEACLIEFNRFPKTASATELYAFLTEDGAEFHGKEETLSIIGAFKPARNDIIFMPFGSDYIVGIVTSCDKGVLTYVLGDVDCTVSEIDCALEDLPSDAIIVRWREDDDFLIPYFSYLCNEIGFTPAAASGVIANFLSESRFNPLAVGDNGTSFGLCQWHYSRWISLVEVCEDAGIDWRTTDGQLFYLKYEIEHKYSEMRDSMNRLGNSWKGAYDCGDLFCRRFECPAELEKACASRASTAGTWAFPVYKQSMH